MYKLVSVDAWASDEGSWNWNAWYGLGEPMSEDSLPDTVAEFVQHLVDNGFATLSKSFEDTCKGLSIEIDNNSDHGNVTLSEQVNEKWCDDDCESDCDEHLVSPRPIYAFIHVGEDD